MFFFAPKRTIERFISLYLLLVTNIYLIAMNNKSLSLYLLLLLVFASGSAFAQQKVSILGDSYSTFHDYVTPDSNICWYGVPGVERENDVKKVEETWWHHFINSHGYQLEINNSYSGATICNTGYKQADYTDRSFVTRMSNLGKPDVIFIFGGTNDSWAGVPIGNYQYESWTKEDLFYFRPAFCQLLDYVIKHYPGAEVYNITNTGLSEDIVESIREICRHYNITNISLHDIDKQWGHPSIQGMKSISEQIWSVVANLN